VNPESRRARLIDLRGIKRRGLCAERLRLAARCTTLRTGRRGDGIAKRPGRRDARLGLAGSGVHLQPRCDGNARSERQERPARDLARRAQEGKPPTGGGSNVLCPLGPRVADRQPASTRETRVICTPAEGAKAIVDRRSPALCKSASGGHRTAWGQGVSCGNLPLHGIGGRSLRLYGFERPRAQSILLSGRMSQPGRAVAGQPPFDCSRAATLLLAAAMADGMLKSGP
jgi:hypothetical protein